VPHSRIAPAPASGGHLAHARTFPAVARGCATTVAARPRPPHFHLWRANCRRIRCVLGQSGRGRTPCVSYEIWRDGASDVKRDHDARGTGRAAARFGGDTPSPAGPPKIAGGSSVRGDKNERTSGPHTISYNRTNRFASSDALQPPHSVATCGRRRATTASHAPTAPHPTASPTAAGSPSRTSPTPPRASGCSR